MAQHKKYMRELPAEIMLRQMAQQLKAAGFASAALDARLLLQGITGISRTELLAGRARPLDAEAQQRLQQAVERRLKHESVHRILGRRAFYGLDFALSPDTLEPRPDTEALVDLLLPVIKAKQAKLPLSSAVPLTLLDMGTGSGAIALALLAQLPQLHAVGVDIAEGALKAAQENAEAAGLAERFTAQKSDWFAAVTGRFDFIVSNPPYIRHDDIAGLALGVRLYDPLRALDGGADGLDFYRALAAGALAHLAAGGRLAVEIGFGQAADVTAIFAAGGFTLQASQKDLSGTLRALLFAPA